MHKKAQVAVGGAGMRAELFAKDEMVTSEDHVSTKCVCVCVCVLVCVCVRVCVCVCGCQGNNA